MCYNYAFIIGVRRSGPDMSSPPHTLSLEKPLLPSIPAVFIFLTFISSLNALVIIKLPDKQLVMAALRSRCADIMFFALWFFLLSFIFFPRLFSAVADWMSTILPHMVTWSGLSATLGCKSETCCTRLAEKSRKQKIAICAPSHRFVGLYLRN